jgi:hypothetical protein
LQINSENVRATTGFDSLVQFWGRIVAGENKKGASLRNEDELLPYHFYVASFRFNASFVTAFIRKKAAFYNPRVGTMFIACTLYTLCCSL